MSKNKQHIEVSESDIEIILGEEFEKEKSERGFFGTILDFLIGNKNSDNENKFLRSENGEGRRLQEGKQTGVPTQAPTRSPTYPFPTPAPSFNCKDEELEFIEDCINGTYAKDGYIAAFDCSKYGGPNDIFLKTQEACGTNYNIYCSNNVTVNSIEDLCGNFPPISREKSGSSSEYNPLEIAGIAAASLFGCLILGALRKCCTNSVENYGKVEENSR